MASFGKQHLHVTEYLRCLRGESHPFLAKASDGNPYVVKPADSTQGENLLFNEAAGTELFRACGLPVTPWQPILVSDDFLNRSPDRQPTTLENRQMGTSTLCFGTRYLGSDLSVTLEMLPASYFERIHDANSLWLAWLVDACARNTGHRQALFLSKEEYLLEPVFIGFRNMFGGPNGNEIPNIAASRYQDHRIYSRLIPSSLSQIKKSLTHMDSELLWRKIDRLPDAWKNYAAVSAFASCLNRLSHSLHVERVFDAMLTSACIQNVCSCSAANADYLPLWESSYWTVTETNYTGYR